MSLIDIESLLAPVAPDSPCGENLEYDPQYAALEQAAAGKPEQQFGSTVIPAEEPDWRQVRQRSLELFARSKDLRIGQYLTQALLNTDGLAGLADGLGVLAGLIDRFWDAVHPQLDPEDDNDPTLRLNTVASLCDSGTVLRWVRDATLVRSRTMGTFSYRDVLIVSGELPPPAEGEKPDGAALEGAFADCDADELKATAAAVNRALELARGLEDSLTRQVGVAQAPSLEPLADLLKAMSKLMHGKLAARGLLEEQEPASVAGSNGDAEAVGENANLADGSANGHRVNSAMSLTGDITSREDVIRAIDKICDYYKRYEPSSPVPLFLNRAKRLASKSFLEILRDLTPDALTQALALGGISEAGQPGGLEAEDV